MVHISSLGTEIQFYFQKESVKKPEFHLNSLSQASPYLKRITVILISLKRPSLLQETFRKCAEQNASFVTPPSTQVMVDFMRETQKFHANFLTPIGRYNSTHYSDGGILRKLSDLESTNLLSMENTCNYTYKYHYPCDDHHKDENRSIFTKPLLYWGEEDFYVSSE